MSFVYEIQQGEIPDLTKNPGFPNSEATILAVCEGEIHNLREIRDEIGGTGNLSSGNSSEFIAAAYEKWGSECFRKLNGAFACYVLDKAKRELILARDQIGRVPLYFSKLGNRFIFSSDLSAIVKSEGFPREIDPVSLNYYMALRYIPADRTIFKNVRRVLPGTFVSYHMGSGRLNHARYWEPPMEESESGNEEELLLELDELFEEAIRLRLGGDSIPGAFLSGGLDSSLIVALMSRLSPGPVKTFIVGYSDKNYDETRYSRIVSRHFGTDHHELFVEPDRDHFIDCVSRFHEPLADPSIIPTSYALALAGANVKLVLSGDGADGLFLGFRTHRFSLKHLAIDGILPQPLKHLRGKVAGFFPKEHVLRVFLEDITSKQFFLRRNTVFSDVMRMEIFRPWVIEALGEGFYEPERYAASAFESYGGTFGGKMGFFTYRSDPDDILYKIHSLSSDQGLNVRTPFLDTNIVEFALGKVPANLKIKGDTTKYLLKRLAQKYLPSELPLERKRGFNPPLSRWLKNEWKEFMAEILLDGNDEFFDRKYIERLIRLNEKPRSDQTRRLFALMVFKIWRMKYT